MKDERIKELTRELKYLPKVEIQKEIEYYNTDLESENIDIKELAKKIYAKRGIDYTKSNKGGLNSFNIINDFINVFNNKDNKTKGKMLLEIIYIIILLILIKIPFNLVRDLGYDFIPKLLTNDLYYNLWNASFLILYIITIICTLILLIKNFNNKYANKNGN